MLPPTLLEEAEKGRMSVTITRTTTVPSFLIALKWSGSNSDFLNHLNGAQFRGGMYHSGHEPLTALMQHLLVAPCGSTLPGAYGCAADVGMNSGFYSLLFAAMGCRVRSFEVQAELVTLVSLSARLNGFDRLSIQHMAAGDGQGTAHISKDAGGSTAVTRGDGLSQPVVPIRVPMASLDSKLRPWLSGCSNEAIPVMKMDVEGFELFAISGMRHMLASKRIYNLIFEFGGIGRWARSNQSAGDAVNVLQTIVDSGYELRLLHAYTFRKHKRAHNWTRQSLNVTSTPGARSLVANGTVRFSLVPRDGLWGLVMPFDVNLWAVALPPRGLPLQSDGDR